MTDTRTSRRIAAAEAALHEAIDLLALWDDIHVPTGEHVCSDDERARALGDATGSAITALAHIIAANVAAYPNGLADSADEFRRRLAHLETRATKADIAAAGGESTARSS